MSIMPFSYRPDDASSSGTMNLQPLPPAGFQERYSELRELALHASPDDQSFISSTLIYLGQSIARYHHVPYYIDEYSPPDRLPLGQSIEHPHKRRRLTPSPPTEQGHSKNTSQQSKRDIAQAQSSKRKSTVTATITPSPAPTEGTPQSSARQKPTPSELVEARLDKLVLPMSTDVDTDTLAAMRGRFCSRIQQLHMVVFKAGKSTTATFSTDEVVNITNFFFSEMLGPKALRRLADLVHYYSGEVDSDIDKGLAQRAQILAEDSKTPQVLRRFFGVLSKTTDQDTDDHRMFKHVKRLDRSLDFVKEYNHLRTLAQQKDPSLIRALKAQGQVTSKGVTLTTCLFNVLQDSLAISRTNLSNMIQNVVGIQKLVDGFGEGLILLLPTGAGRQLLDWGHQRMAYVYPILREELQGLSEVCKFIQDGVLDPIRRGDPIPLTQIKTSTEIKPGTKASLQERIKEAIKEEAERSAL